MIHSNNLSGTNGLIPNRYFTRGSESLVLYCTSCFIFLYGDLLALYNYDGRVAPRLSLEIVQGLVSLDSIYFAFWVVPVALAHTVRLVRLRY